MPWPEGAWADILRAVPKPAASVAEMPKRSTSFEPEVARAVGAAIRRAREDREYSQDGFALQAGVDRSYYGKLERGERQPTVGLLLRIARALGVSGADLLSQAEALMAERPMRRRTRS